MASLPVERSYTHVLWGQLLVVFPPAASLLRGGHHLSDALVPSASPLVALHLLLGIADQVLNFGSKTLDENDASSNPNTAWSVVGPTMLRSNGEAAT